MDSNTAKTFYGLSSILIFLMLLVMLGILAPIKSSKIQRTGGVNTITYVSRHPTKQIVYSPSVYVLEKPFHKREF